MTPEAHAHVWDPLRSIPPAWRCRLCGERTETHPKELAAVLQMRRIYEDGIAEGERRSRQAVVAYLLECDEPTLAGWIENGVHLTQPSSPAAAASSGSADTEATEEQR